MINEIKQVIEGYLGNVGLSKFITGMVEDNGIQIDESLTIPFELVVGNLKKALKKGDGVRLLRNHGGQQFFLLEVVEHDS